MIDFSDFLNQPFVLDDGGSSAISAMDILQQYAEVHHFDLSPVEIVQSVQDASAFFNIDMPAEIHYGQITGVCNHMADTMTDDVLYISPEQMTDIGITGKEAFDLVMTHEGAHRALQGIDTHFNIHQEELCCDMMAGVRAGLNPEDLSMDAIEAMKASLTDTKASDKHPAGADRKNIIDEGVKFAQAYYAEHHCAPSLYECIDHFNELQGDHAINDIHGLVTLRPDDAPEAIKAYSRQEINNRMHKAKNDMDYWKSQWESHLRLAKHSMWRETELMHARDAQRKYEAAKQEYNHWKYEKPDDIKGYTTSDIDWLEQQVRISSGSEQANWLEKLNWATAHIHNYAPSEGTGSIGYSSDDKPKPPSETLGSVGFAGGTGSDVIPDNGYADTRFVGDGFTEEQPMFTYDQLREAGFSDYLAKSMLNPEMPHSYSQEELHDVLYSENPVEAYNQMMSAKAQVNFQRTAKLEREINRNLGIFVNI